MKKKPEKTSELSKSKKIIFKMIMILLPLFILLFTELCLRIFSYGVNLDLFVQHPNPDYKEYLMVNPEIGKKYFRKFSQTSPRNDIFLKKKPGNTTRIFVMGSSTVYGFPYESNLMYSRILNQMLEDTYPDRKFEIVNTAITAVNSITLADFIDEILDQEPDAILLYAGHNEFYGAMGIGSNENTGKSRLFSQLYLKMMRLRLFQLLQNTMNSLPGKLAGDPSDQVSGTLMKRIVADKDILLNSEEYKIATERYKENISEILNKSSGKNVPVYMGDLVSNVKDLPPFNSIARDTLPAAIDVFKLAQKALADSNYTEAERLFYYAKDLDCIRFRASEELNEIITGLATKYNSQLVPMKATFKNASEHGIIGNDLLMEHVHPNIKGYFLMARAFYDKIIASKLIPGENEYNNDPGIQYYLSHYGYTSLDELLGYHRVANLEYHWPFNADFTSVLDYRKIYHPGSYLDSLAFNIMKNPEMNLDVERLKLAEKYKAAGQYYNAYREFEALLRMNPYISISYRDAADCLVKLSELPLALKYFEKSIEYEESYFGYFRAGEILLLKNDFDKAVTYFRKAEQLVPEKNRPGVLFKLYAALYYGNRKGEAGIVRNELLKLSPQINLNLPQGRYYYMDYIPLMVSGDIENARKEIASKNFGVALERLQSSLAKWDSPITYRLIGNVYLQKQEYSKALLFYKKVESQFNTDPEFLREFLFLDLSLNDGPGARNKLEMIKKINPGNPAIGILEKIVNGDRTK